MSKHTPGRWVAFKERHFWVVKDEQGQRLASLLESESVFTDGVEHDDAQANAELMAAAPTLRAHLEAVLARAEYTEECIESDRGKGLSVEQLYAAKEMPQELVEARAFLAQLKGEQP